MPRKVGRPRMKASDLSIWGVYKRNRRKYGGDPKTVLHHVNGDKGLGTPLKRLTRSAHAAEHNRRRKTIKRSLPSRAA
jgi:hypothetical protein